MVGKINEYFKEPLALKQKKPTIFSRLSRRKEKKKKAGREH